MALVSAEKTGVNEYTIQLSIDGETFEKSINKIYNREKGKINVPGFRKGKAPRKFIEKLYGENIFYDDALDDAFPPVYEAAIEEAKIEPVDSPFDFDIGEIGADGVSLTCKVTVKPEIELSEYKGLSAYKAEDIVTDEEVEKEIENFQKQNARQVSVDDRAVEDGDIVNLDFEGFVDDVAFDGGKAEGFDLVIGSGQFIPGFEEQVIGHKIDEEFDINVKFPEEYGSEELANKDAVFKIKINSISYEELPELDDEFAKDISEFDTFDEFKEDVKETLLNRKKEESKQKFENEILSKLAANVEGEIPDVMVEKMIDNSIANFEQNLQSSGMNLEMYLGYLNTDMESFRENHREGALHNVKISLAIEKVVELEKLSVAEEDIEKEYADLAEKYQMDVERIKALVPQEHLEKDLESRKAIDLIVDSANVLDEPEEKEEVEEAEETEEVKEEDKE